MASALTLALPRFIVLRSDEYQKNYMGYIHEKENSYYGYLQFQEIEAESPYAKFEVEPANIDGLVHIKSSRNNKYWERTKNINILNNPEEQYWITATATKPENDQSKESCTLFKPISADAVNNTIRIMHVQSGCYVCLWNIANLFVLANYKVHDDNRFDIFQVIDWDSLVILPRYLAFKGDNAYYLRLIQNSYLQFSADGIDDSTATFERFNTSDGILRIKSTSNDKFWRRSPNWIWADSDDTSNSNTDTLFHPIKIDDHTISLLNLGNNQFCKRLTMNGVTDCLNAYVTSTTLETKLTVEEPVSKRDINNFKYDLQNSKVYDETVHVMATSSVTNNGEQDITYEVNLHYTGMRTSTWNTMFSLKLETKTNLDLSVPLIVNGNVELSDEVQSGVKWGETSATAPSLVYPQEVVAPPMTTVTVYLVATKGKCDVPFTFTQDDTLYNGETVTTEVGGTYTGSNYYNFHVDTKEENI